MRQPSSVMGSESMSFEGIRTNLKLVNVGCGTPHVLEKTHKRIRAFVREI